MTEEPLPAARQLSGAGANDPAPPPPAAARDSYTREELEALNDVWSSFAACSYLAVPVKSRSGEVLGGLFFAHPEPGRFDERAERLVVGVALQAAAAIDNARLYEDAQRELAQRRKAEQQLRESEEQFRALFEQTTSGIAETDLTGRFIKVNDRYCEIVGLPRDVLRKLRMHDITHPDDLGTNASQLAALVEGGPSFEIEKRYLRPDGSDVWVHNQVSAIRDAGGRTRSLVAVVSGIGARKRTENLLERQKQILEQLAGDARLEQVLESLCDAVEGQSSGGAIATVLLTDQSGNHLAPAAGPRCPPEYSAALGAVPFGENEGSCGTAAHRRETVVAADIAADPRWSAYREIALRNGLASCWSAPILSPSGAVLGTFAVYHPTAREPETRELRVLEVLARTASVAIERDRTQRNLAESEARFRLALDIAGQGTWSWQPDANIVQADARCREICGLDKPGPLTKEDVDERLHPDDAQRVNRGLGAALSTSGDGRYAEEFRLIHADGSERWVVSRGQARFTGGGGSRRAESMVGTVLDITEHKRAEHALQEADRRKDEFLATLAHELRNPLAPLRNSLTILRMSGDGRASSIHDVMERQVQHMVRLVDDLLDVSRITRGKIELQRERLSLDQLLRDVLETARTQIDEAGHEVSLTLPSATLPVEGDTVRLAQVFGNLLSNAIKYTPGAGRISVSARRDGAEAVVSVRDNGIGIPKEMLSRVFETFAQVDQGLSRAQGGLGIGLSLARNLVELHGGRVEAGSLGPGQGSEFIVRLPLARAPSNSPPIGGTRESAAKAHREGARRRRILVVDDNRDAARSLAILLKFLGAEVQVANDGINALSMVEAFRPEVLLLDLGMPGMNGLEVAQRVRQRLGRTVTIIALTGWGQEQDRKRTREAGFDHHLVKPPDLAALQGVLASLDTAR